MLWLAPGKINLLTFVGFLSVILGYPALLKMRFFTLRADDPKDENDRTQIVLDLAEACASGYRSFYTGTYL